MMSLPIDNDGLRYKGQAHFTTTSWQESVYFESEAAPKLARACLIKSYTGNFLGEGHAEYLLLYHPNGQAEFTGHERVTALLDGKRGQFVLRHDGTFEDGIASAACFVIADSATGELAGLTGAGYITAQGPKARFEFDFDLS